MTTPTTPAPYTSIADAKESLIRHCSGFDCFVGVGINASGLVLYVEKEECRLVSLMKDRDYHGHRVTIVVSGNVKAQND